MSTDEESQLKSINLKTLLTLIGIVTTIAGTSGAWYLMQYRVEQLEEVIDLEKARVSRLETQLSAPRFTLEDYEIRTNAFRESIIKELDRSSKWMSSHDSFRLETVKATAETSANVREIKSLLISLKTEIETLKQQN
jgi:uncharacterized protein (DUF342 family)